MLISLIAAELMRLYFHVNRTFLFVCTRGCCYHALQLRLSEAQMFPHCVVTVCSKHTEQSMKNGNDRFTGFLFSPLLFKHVLTPAAPLLLSWRLFHLHTNNPAFLSSSDPETYSLFIYINSWRWMLRVSIEHQWIHFNKLLKIQITQLPVMFSHFWMNDWNY